MRHAPQSVPPAPLPASAASNKGTLEEQLDQELEREGVALEWLRDGSADSEAEPEPEQPDKVCTDPCPSYGFPFIFIL